MVFDEDIVRGVRRGAILLVALLIGVATYRILHAMVPGREDATPEVSVPEEPPSLAVGPPMVPPPPPRPGDNSGRKLVRRHRAPTPDPQPATIESMVKADPEVETPAGKPAEGGPWGALQPALQQEDQPDAAGRDEYAPAPEAQSARNDSGIDQSQKTSPRRLRWLKAMGRFLQAAGKNVSQPDALR